MSTGRKLAMLVLTGAMVSVGTLASATGAQAAPQPEPRAGVTAAPYYYIINKHSGKCLQPKSPSYANSIVVQRTCGPWGGMTWGLFDIGGGYYWLINQYSGMCMDLQANSEEEVVRGTLVQQFWCSAAYTSEQWRLVPGPAPSGYYQLVNRVKGLCADIQFRSSANEAKLQVIECKYNEPAQLFRFA
ncbi:MAG TPA: hypothetical protein DGT23_01180 [Micromonosporaceae bacterium]|nr:hypothetical protein [Micromonosporaceae bacterium]